MITIIIILVICIGFLTYFIYTKMMSSGTLISVGIKYAPALSESFRDHFFRSLDGKIHNSCDYIKVRVLDNFGPLNKGDIVFVDAYTEPIKNSICLFKKDNNYRLAKCISCGTLRWEPYLFDGHETPGIGYDFLGVVRYHENNILKKWKL